MQTPITYRRWLTVFAVIAITACGGSTVTDTPDPVSPVDTTKPPTTVQRASVTVRVAVDPADASLAQQAGVGISGLTVRLTSSRPGEAVRTAVTASDGTVRFDNLLEGIYTATAERALTSTEVARLSPADREASVFAGGGQTILSPPANASATVTLVGARRGSVVISEIFANYGPYQIVEPNYVFGSYIEVYNNSDTTAYLDGMLLVITPVGWHAPSNITGPCDDPSKRLRLDSTAVYSTTTLAFPGTGRDYPIHAGEAKVVAMDAINHQVAAPTKEQVDLSHAQFEQFWTDADVDNPESVNMIKVLGPASGVFGHGMGYFSGRLQHVLLSADARAATTMARVPSSNAASGSYEIPRLPSQYILDLVALEYSPQSFGYENNGPSCVPWTAPSYDRAPAPLIHGHQRKSITRKSLGFTADGREILQRTRNSERDFWDAEPLRRSLNK